MHPSLPASDPAWKLTGLASPSTWESSQRSCTVLMHNAVGWMSRSLIRQCEDSAEQTWGQLSVSSHNSVRKACVNTSHEVKLTLVSIQGKGVWQSGTRSYFFNIMDLMQEPLIQTDCLPNGTYQPSLFYSIWYKLNRQTVTVQSAFVY